LLRLWPGRERSRRASSLRSASKASAYSRLDPWRARRGLVQRHRSSSCSFVALWIAQREAPKVERLGGERVLSDPIHPIHLESANNLHLAGRRPSDLDGFDTGCTSEPDLPPIRRAAEARARGDGRVDVPKPGLRPGRHLDSCAEGQAIRSRALEL